MGFERDESVEIEIPDARVLSREKHESLTLGF